MKTITLRQLLREPLAAKRWTHAGKPVQVTDKGKPLWILQPAEVGRDDEARRRATDEILDEVLREAPSSISAVRLLEECRR